MEWYHSRIFLHRGKLCFWPPEYCCYTLFTFTFKKVYNFFGHNLYTLLTKFIESTSFANYIIASILRCHASDEFWTSAPTEGTISVTIAPVNNKVWKLHHEQNPHQATCMLWVLYKLPLITRMNNSRLPLITIDGSMKGTSPRGRPPKRWTDGCKESCQARGLASLTEAKRLTQKRHNWRTFICSSHLNRA